MGNADSLAAARRRDRQRFEGMQQASNTPAVDQYFAEQIADCQARGKAARLRARQLMSERDQ